MDDVSEIRAALEEYRKLRRLELLPRGDDLLWIEIVPPGGDWQCIAKDGAITRTLVWQGKEIAQVNARGDLTDEEEAQIAMGMAAAPTMNTALKAIAMLARKSATNIIIERVALAAIAYSQRAAPTITEPED